MIKNFDTIKFQLRELAEVINAFKSEAVQLRLVELVFEVAGDDSDDSEGGTGPERRAADPTRKARKVAKKSAPTDAAPAKGKASGRPGGKSMLDRLVGEGFFKKPKTIKQVVEHCEHNLAFKYKQTDFSGALGRLTRSGTLTRKKNADKQYEYSQS
jgi:hypothetical protein